MYKTLEQVAELPKGKGRDVIEALTALAQEQLGPKGTGVLTIPGLAKLRAVAKPARPERQGVDPFTKQPRVFAAKPASIKIVAKVVKDFTTALGTSSPAKA